MPTHIADPLVSCEWLAARLGDPRLAILDASFFLPVDERSACSEYLAEHLPGSHFFDVDAIADPGNGLPHMLPEPRSFAAAVARTGIGADTWVVVYDNNSFLASARVWWTFRVFGHDRVSVLDGGLRRWKALGALLESGATAPAPAAEFRAAYRPELVRNLDQMQTLLAGPGSQIVDARSPGRFAGSEPEPRPGLRSGHIPGSRNVFFNTLIDAATGRLKPASALEAEFHQAGLDLDGPVVATCGTGITAAILALALYRLGRRDTAVYDGSWTEWGARDDTAVAIG
jgi:thiosulfate/3-mercaptopyruvate sulfurtransferase